MSRGYSVIPTVQPDERVQQSILSDLLGFEVLRTLHRDAKLLILCKVVRMFSFGFLAVMLVVYLNELKFSAKEVGLMFTLTLLGMSLNDV